MPYWSMSLSDLWHCKFAEAIGCLYNGQQYPVVCIIDSNAIELFVTLLGTFCTEVYNDATYDT